MGDSTPFPEPAAIARAELFTREQFVYDGETLEDALSPGSARRRALDAALTEIDAGGDRPSIDWRRKFSLLLGLERLLSEEEPQLADGAVLSAHQVDALSGTLTALLAEAQRGANGSANGSANGAGPTPPPEPSPLASAAIPGEEDSDDDLDETESEEEEPQDWQDDGELDEDVQLDERPEDPNADRRFWFEHATGAGKTVAALGFVEASRTGGVLILTHRRNLVDQFNGELRDRGYRDRIHAPLLDGRDAANGPVTVETYQWFVRNAGKISDAYTIVICDEAHTALGEKTSAAIRAWAGPIFIGMTATGALIARHVTDLFPTQTSRFDLAQAARRGVIAPLRCIRIPPGPGVRTIAKVPLRRGEVDTEFDQEMLAELLDQTPFNMAIADLYKTRFNNVPGVVYAAGVRHAYNVAKAFQDMGMKAKGVSGETPKRQLARILADYESGKIDVLVNAQLLAEGWNSPRATICMHLAPTASKRIYQQRVGRVTRRHPGKEAGHRRRLRAPGDQARRPGGDAAFAARSGCLSGAVRSWSGRCAEAEAVGCASSAACCRSRPIPSGARRCSSASCGGSRSSTSTTASSTCGPRWPARGWPPTAGAGPRPCSTSTAAGSSNVASCSPRCRGTGIRNCACGRCRRSPPRGTRRRSTPRSTSWPAGRVTSAARA